MLDIAAKAETFKTYCINYTLQGLFYQKYMNIEYIILFSLTPSSSVIKMKSATRVPSKCVIKVSFAVYATMY